LLASKLHDGRTLGSVANASRLKGRAPAPGLPGVWGALTRFHVGRAGSDPWSLRPVPPDEVRLSGRSTSLYEEGPVSKVGFALAVTSGWVGGFELG
jgi:hypothetical protein